MLATSSQQLPASYLQLAINRLPWQWAQQLEQVTSVVEQYVTTLLLLLSAGQLMWLGVTHRSLQRRSPKPESVNLQYATMWLFLLSARQLMWLGVMRRSLQRRSPSLKATSLRTMTRSAMTSRRQRQSPARRKKRLRRPRNASSLPATSPRRPRSGARARSEVSLAIAHAPRSTCHCMTLEKLLSVFERTKSAV